MAFVLCRACGNQVSPEAPSCPRCGATRSAVAESGSSPATETTPSPFRKPSRSAPLTPIGTTHEPYRTARSSEKEGGRKLTFVQVLWGGLGVLGLTVLLGVGGRMILLPVAVVGLSIGGILWLRRARPSALKKNVPTLAGVLILWAGGVFTIALIGTQAPTSGDWWIGPWVDCKQNVTARLKSASTARFETVPDVRHNPGSAEAFIISHVDAQNSFGAMIRTRFICKLKKAGEAWIIEAVVFEK